MASPLKKDYRKKLRKGSRRTVIETFLKLKKHFRSNRWIGLNNTYLKNATSNLRKGIDISWPSPPAYPGHNINKKHISEYISASAILHCEDGWSYFGKAISSLLNMDTATARHLAYYAELRAAMALLATEGIGMFSEKHIIVSKNDIDYIPFDHSTRANNKKQKIGTHEATWKVLDHWTTLVRSKSLLSKILNPSDIKLSEWLETFGLTSADILISQYWLKQIGVDIKKFGEDRDARNYLSYRPTGFHERNNIDFEKIITCVLEVWQLSLDLNFNILDRFVLRKSLQMAHKIITGNEAALDQVTFGNRIDFVLGQLSPSGLPTPVWKTFLTTNTTPTPLLMEMAGHNNNYYHPDHHLEILGRAFLLLRIATGSALDMMQESGVKSNDIEFWWRPLGERLGIWTPGDDLSDLNTTINTNIQDSIAEIQDWKQGANFPALTSFDLKSQIGNAFENLSSTERIPIYNFGMST